VNTPGDDSWGHGLNTDRVALPAVALPAVALPTVALPTVALLPALMVIPHAVWDDSIHPIAARAWAA
jgi:hypothetical protein